MTDPYRKKDLARIHLTKKELGLEDQDYRDLLRSLTGKSSAGDLTVRERCEVLRAMDKLRAKPAAASHAFPGRPVLVPFELEPLIDKVEALLAEARRPWDYAHVMAQRMFGRDQVQHCSPDECRRIVAAMIYDAKRHGRFLG